MGRPSRQVACRAGCASGAARSAVAGLEQLAAFVLVQPAPDAVRLTEVDRVIEAFSLHGALAADGLGPRLTHLAVLAPFRVGRREEQGRLRAPACRTCPPRVECVDDHGLSSPYPECLAARKLLGRVAA